MTEESGEWTPEFWAATGSLGFDVAGLSFASELDVEYRRNDAELGEAYTIDRASLETSSNSLMEADGEALDVVITKNTKDEWSLQRWTAVGSLTLILMDLIR